MNKSYFVLFAALLILNTPLSSQSPYQINWKHESAYLTTGIITTALGTYLANNATPYTPQQVYALDRNTISRFDRSATFKHSYEAANWSDILMIGSHTLPALFLLKQQSRSDFLKISLMFGEMYLLTNGVTLLTKSATLRPRPFVYNEAFDDGIKLTRTARFSFFSGHTSTAAANSFFFAKVFSDYFPDSKLKPYVWGFAIAIPAVTGYLRVAAGKHYPSDVIAGYSVGAAIGYLVPFFHKNASPSISGLSFYPGFGIGTIVWRF